ncbi:MAG: two-component system regulatory protein YycI [Anaerovoracaceae bacterium]|jgi:uncharacterized protein (UPF0179 family)
MDWTKAKTILILALLAANIFLIITFVFIRAEDSPNEQMLEEETIALLEQKNVYIKNDLPTKHSKMPVLIVEYDRLDPNVLQEKLWAQVPLMDNDQSEEKILQITEDFLKNCGIWGENVHLDRVEKQGLSTKVYYKNIFEGMKIEDSYIICNIENGQITEVQRYWLNPIEIGRTKKTTISASVALINFISEKDDSDVILVEDMEMVYWLDSTAYGMETTISDTAFPAWKITYNGGQIKHIPAYVD